MHAVLTHLPRPSKHHATCAWCRVELPTVVELIDHIDVAHGALALARPAPPPRHSLGRAA